eukprot:2518893-Pyramimonas_sp.AAC.2
MLKQPTIRLRKRDMPTYVHRLACACVRPGKRGGGSIKQILPYEPFKRKKNSGIMGLEKMAGTWLCTEVRNFEALFEKLNVNWVKRKAAKTFGFGKDRAVQKIVVEGSRITISLKGMYTMTNTFVLGARNQHAYGPDMSKMNCEDCLLQNSVLEMVLIPKTHYKLLLAKRFMREDGKMIQQFECEGVVAWQEFTKHGAPLRPLPALGHNNLLHVEDCTWRAQLPPPESIAAPGRAPDQPDIAGAAPGLG